MKKVFIVIVALCMGLGCLTDVANARWIRGFEAEAGIRGADSITGNLSTRAGDDALGEYFVAVGTDENVGDNNNNSPPPEASRGFAFYTFDAPAGQVKVLYRYTKETSNSIWFRILNASGNPVVNNPVASDPGGWVSTNGMRGTNYQLSWDRVFNDRAPDAVDRDPVIFTLPSGGTYKMEWTYREDGVFVDGFVITDDLSLGRNYMRDNVDFIRYSELWVAENPTPADGAPAQPATGLVLQWEAPTVIAPPAAVTRYDVYLVEGPEGDPNSGTPIGSVAGDAPLLQLDIDADSTFGAMAEGTAYSWRVNTVIVGSPDQVAVGQPWSFVTVVNDPVITAQPVAYAERWRDESVTFSLAATSGDLDNQGPMTYQWYDASDDSEITDETGTDLIITAGTEDISVYCKITNVNETIQSDNATLHVKKWVGHWTFDEGSGDVAADSSPEYHRVTATPNDGTLEVAAEELDDYWTTEGKIGGALNMHGLNSNTDEKVSTGKVASELGIGGNAPRTFSVWVYTRRWNEGAPYEIGNRSNAQNWSLRTIGTGSQQTDHWRIQYWGGDRDFWTWRNEGNRVAETRNWFFQTHKTWTHFVHTHDGTNTKIYANGVLIVDWIKGSLNTLDGQPLKIGHWRDREFDGMIDDLRIFNFAASIEEVIEMYAVGEPDAKFCQGSNPADIDGDCDADLDDLMSTVESYLNTGIIP